MEVPSSAGKCWWCGDLGASKAVEEKARRAYFHYGSTGAFQGDLIPLSLKSVIESCCLFFSIAAKTGSSLTLCMFSSCFEVAKALTNTAVCTAMDMQSTCPLIFGRKLYLIDENGSGPGVGVMHSVMDDVEAVSLVRECRELED